MEDSSPIPAAFIIVLSSRKWVGLRKDFTTVASAEEALTRAVKMGKAELEYAIEDRTMEEVTTLLAEPGWWCEYVNHHECEEPLVTCKLFSGGTWTDAFDFEADVLPRIQAELLEDVSARESGDESE